MIDKREISLFRVTTVQQDEPWLMRDDPDDRVWTSTFTATDALGNEVKLHLFAGHKHELIPEVTKRGNDGSD